MISLVCFLRFFLNFFWGASRWFYNFCLSPLILARFKELYAAPKDQYFAEVFVSNSLAYCELGILGRFSCIWPLKLEYCKTLQQNHDFCKICTRKLHPVTTKPLFFFPNGTPLQQNHGFSRTTKPDKPSIWRRREIKVLYAFSWKFIDFGWFTAPAKEFAQINGFWIRQWIASWHLPDQDPGRRKTLKTRVFHLNGNALSRPWMPEKHKNHEVCSNREHWIGILDARKT